MAGPSRIAAGRQYSQMLLKDASGDYGPISWMTRWHSAILKKSVQHHHSYQVPLIVSTSSC
jgi:hypothetical protein